MSAALQRLGVRWRLLLAFFGISAFAVIAAAAGLYAFGEVGKLLGRITQERVPPALASLELSRQAELAEKKDFPGFIAADKEFHRLMYIAAGLPRLWAVVVRMSGHVDRLRLLHSPFAGKTDSIMAGHEAILNAIASGDADAATLAVREHLSGTLASVDEIQQRYPEYLIL